MGVGAVGAVGSFGAGQIDPELISRYASLNKKLKLKRQGKTEGVESLIGDMHPRVEPFEATLTPEELREIYTHPVLLRTPIKIAYTVLQRICDETIRESQNTEYLKKIAVKMYKG